MRKTKTALIYGVTGQDGSILSDYLLGLGYSVIGVARRNSTPNTSRIDHVLKDPQANFTLVEGDITDPISVLSTVSKYKPDELYNLASQSHVATSFDQPHYTTSSVYMGCMNVLEAVRAASLATHVYYANSSEQFGSSIDDDGYQRETTPFCPRSPYGVAKLAAFHLCNIYRDAYNMHISCGILFNHTGERRGEKFVTRKITKYIAEMVHNKKNMLPLHLGNMSAHRDWGYAGDFIKAMHTMLQQETPDDYVIATGKTWSVEDFADLAFKEVGEDFRDWILIDEKLYRPAEVEFLKGDASKARKQLGWTPTVSFAEIVRKMVVYDIENYKS